MLITRSSTGVAVGGLPYESHGVIVVPKIKIPGFVSLGALKSKMTTVRVSLIPVRALGKNIHCRNNF